MSLLNNQQKCLPSQFGFYGSGIRLDGFVKIYIVFHKIVPLQHLIQDYISTDRALF